MSASLRPSQAHAAPEPDARALREAAIWLMRLNSGEADARTLRAWQRWRSRNPASELAWQRAEQLQQRLGRLPSPIARPSLERAEQIQSLDRRRALQMLMLLMVATPVGYGLRHPASAWTADYRTATGEWRELELPDGSRVALDTASAIDVRFDASQRLVALHAGEILVTTAHQPRGPSRPFLVETRHGLLRALGTRFTVRAGSEATAIAVEQGAVEIAPSSAPQRKQIIPAGWRARFDAHAIQPFVALSGEIGTWAQGVLHADNQRLDDFLAELGRYRPGVLRCAPEVAGLRISGAFQLRDTDHVLDLLAGSLPLRVRRSSRYWTVVEAPN